MWYQVAVATDLAFFTKFNGPVIGPASGREMVRAKASAACECILCVSISCLAMTLYFLPDCFFFKSELYAWSWLPHTWKSGSEETVPSPAVR